MTARALELRDLEAFAGAQIDVSLCDRLEICVGLYDLEKAGPRLETWPDAVRVQVERSMRQWLERNPGRAIKLVSTGVVNRMCVLIVHHAASASAAPANAEADPPAAAAQGAVDHLEGGRGVASPVSPVSPPPPAGCAECGG